MPKAQNQAYDDDVSADEEEELKKLMQSDDVPEPDDQEGARTDDDPDDEEGDDGDDQQPDDQDGDQQVGDEGDDESQGDELAEFLAKHKDKSPEDLARLAFQQSKRANREAYDSRQASERLNDLVGKIRAAQQAKIDELNQRRAAFDQQVESDPDAALREAHRANLDREAREAAQQAESQEFEARAQAAIELASAAIPNFQERAPAIRSFGTEMGFSPQEVDSLVDGRQIVTLYLASIAGNMIKAGLIGADGQFLKLPEPVRENGDARGDQNSQRRTQFARQPARGAGRQPTLEQRLQDVANMSDADFDKLSETELENLLSQADGF